MTVGSGTSPVNLPDSWTSGVTGCCFICGGAVIDNLLKHADRQGQRDFFAASRFCINKIVFNTKMLKHNLIRT